MKRLIWPALLLCLLAQWAVPLTQILRAQQLLREGHRYALPLAPVDPVDAFRGRYLSLAFADTRVLSAERRPLTVDETVYVPITAADRGLAQLGAAQRRAPARGDFLQARVRSQEADGRVELSLPFDRYYLNEAAAPRIEAAYRQATQSQRANTYATIRVLGDRAALEELYLGGVPLPRLAEPSKPAD